MLEPRQPGNWGKGGLRMDRCTFHDARLVDGELYSHVADLDVSLAGEGDAAEEQVELARRA